MKYLKFHPHILLRQFVDFYWVLQTDLNCLKIPLFADATTDLFVNLGNYNWNISTHQPGRMYLCGPATSVHFSNCYPGNVYVGIRFKPGGFPAFYGVPLINLVDQIVEFEDTQLKYLLDVDESLPSRLDNYFLARKRSDYTVTTIADAIYRSKGRISVDLLARECNVSNRTLERYFYNNMGIGPKEFINIVRFHQTLLALEKGYPRGQLVKIAAKLGYYDQSHFIKEVKKRTGSAPSAIGPINSFF